MITDCSPSFCHQRGETALHIACRRREIAIVRLLLRNGAAVDAKTQVSLPSLPCTAQPPPPPPFLSQNYSFATVPLSLPSFSDTFDVSLLSKAPSFSRVPLLPSVFLLIASGAFFLCHVTKLSRHDLRVIQQRTCLQDRETPLHIAVRTKNTELVNLLLDHGASPDVIDKVGSRALCQAREGHKTYMRRHMAYVTCAVTYAASRTLPRGQSRTP